MNLQRLVDKAKALDSPHVDLSKVLGLSSPLLVGADDLHDVLLDHEPPDLVLSYKDATVTVSHVDGGVLANLEVKLP